MSYPKNRQPAVGVVCVIADCESPVLARGWCRKHYLRWNKHGTPEPPVVSFEERFWSKVAKGDGCWEWQAGRSLEGYGQFRLATGEKGGKGVGAHRVAYELIVGPIAPGLHLDHLCRNPPCVRPDHLEQVTPKTNFNRGDGRYVSGSADVRAKKSALMKVRMGTPEARERARQAALKRWHGT